MNEQQHSADYDASDLYVCPTTGETESRTLGGFDVCCADPTCPGAREVPPEVTS
jgi:hypothetical protein